MAKRKRSLGMSDKAFDLVLVIICVILLIVFLYPIIYVVSSSFSSGSAISSGKVFLWPVNFSTYGYRWVFSNKIIWTGYRNTFIYAVFGTIFHLVMTTCLAYPLSRRDYQG
ncbi:MAG: carbohydrate ABC transporter permease, partial [Lachnospiraceae bacterium]|nr:carbohydrate ABC transporter permease [Lachnospiraceae bacterium]